MISCNYLNVFEPFYISLIARVGKASHNMNNQKAIMVVWW